MCIVEQMVVSVEHNRQLDVRCDGMLDRNEYCVSDVSICVPRVRL